MHGLSYLIMGVLVFLTLYMAAGSFIPEFWKANSTPRKFEWYMVNWLGMALGIIIFQLIMEYPWEVPWLSSFFVQAKSSFLMSLFVGAAFSLLVVLVSRCPISIIRVASICLATVVFLPGIFIDWSSMPALTATAGKIGMMILIFLTIGHSRTEA